MFNGCSFCLVLRLFVLWTPVACKFFGLRGLRGCSCQPGDFLGGSTVWTLLVRDVFFCSVCRRLCLSSGSFVLQDIFYNIFEMLGL